MADKGFPSSASESHRAAHPDLHQLNPIRRNSKFIETHGMCEFEGVLPGREGVTCKKAEVRGGGKWLYSFRDAALAAREERAYLEKARKDGKYDHADLTARQNASGSV